MNPGKSAVLTYSGNPLVELLKEDAKQKVLTGDKVELEVGDPVRTLRFEPLWLLNARPEQIDYQLRTYISYSEMKQVVQTLQETQETIQTIASQVMKSTLKLPYDEILSGIKSGALTLDKETKEVLYNGESINPPVVKPVKKAINKAVKPKAGPVDAPEKPKKPRAKKSAD